MTSSIQTRLPRQNLLNKPSLAAEHLFQNGSCRCQILGFLGDKFLGIECTLEAETSVSNLTQYKLFIGDDKKKNTLLGETFSLNLVHMDHFIDLSMKLSHHCKPDSCEPPCKMVHGPCPWITLVKLDHKGNLKDSSKDLLMDLVHGSPL